MKKLILTLIIFTITNTLSFGQTTLTEYNYLTKGYKIQLESGLDMKKGYYIKNVGKWTVNHKNEYSNNSFSRNITFKYLYREGEDIPCATLMISERTDTKFKNYFCIPHYNSSKEIWDKAFQDYLKLTNNWKNVGRDYSWNMIRMISYLSSKKFQ